MTVFEWINKSTELLKVSKFENPLFEARFLAGVSLNKDLSWVLSHPQSLIEKSVADKLLYRRLQHEPLAYISGKREFWGREFLVDSRVLIPRQESEEIINIALSLVASKCTSNVLDLCTGSGCLGITLKLERPFLNLFASDISLDALEVAKINALALGADVELLHGNLFDFNLKCCFDLILCNPPYIAYNDLLNKEVCDYEPSLALFSKKNGFDFYERISSEATQYIDIKGRLILEIGIGQAQKIKEIFESKQWVLSGFKKDLYGIKRCLVFQKSR